MYGFNIGKLSVSLTVIKNMNFSRIVYEWKRTISALIFSKTPFLFRPVGFTCH